MLTPLDIICYSKDGIRSSTKFRRSYLDHRNEEIDGLKINVSVSSFLLGIEHMDAQGSKDGFVNPS
jgi:hypothetical protein